MKKITLLLLLTLGCGYIHEITAKVSIVWQVERKKMWEEDWLERLLQGLDYEIVDDLKFEKQIDNSIIIIVPAQEKQMLAYCKELTKKHYKFGIILFADECYTCSTEFYKEAQFVFRNYWHKQFDNQPNVLCFALGYKSGFWQKNSLGITAANQRKYSWTFAGQISGKPTRREMVNHMQSISSHYVHEIHAWMDPRSLGVGDYQDLLLNSVFVPCSRGYWNIDSFRVWEALECGCIPIVETFPIDYFHNFLGIHPFISVSSWQEAPVKMKALLDNPQTLHAKQLECMQWWANYKKEMNSKMVSIIKSTLLSA